MKTHLLCLLCLSAVATILPMSGVSAQTVTADGPQTYSLTPEERAKVLDANTEASAEIARMERPSSNVDRQIHGEIGAMVGTGGARAAYGVAAIPLSDRAGAVVSFESSRFGNVRRR